MAELPTLSDIRTGAQLKIGEVILRDADLLVTRWADWALEEESSARLSQRSELRNELVGFLKALGTTLDVGSIPRSQEGKAEEHGNQRWNVGWSLSDLIQDYQLLRIVVTDHLVEALERNLTVQEIHALSVAFDDAISAAVVNFVGHQHVELVTANRKMYDFLGLLGHELRNPMNSLMMALELIKQTSEERFLERAKNVMAHSVKQLSHLVDEMLNVTRIVKGQVDCHMEAIDLNEILTHAIHSVQPLLREKDQIFIAGGLGEPIPIIGDSSRLEQVFANLLNNASKYTPTHGQIELNVELESEHVRIQIRDSGNGISPDKLQAIFDMFTRDLSTGDSEDGLGIGLSIVRTFVELHGGTVNAFSEGPNLGSEFVVTLPRKTA